MEQYKKKADLYFELKDAPESTRESYLRRMNGFISFMRENEKPIDDTRLEDIQQYILYLKKERRLSAGTINNYISAVRFFYTYVLEKKWDTMKVPRMRRPEKMPVIPTKADVMTLINNTNNVKHKAIFLLIYGSGLRVSEVAKLKIGDIDSRAMRIRVEDAKHNTNRYTILSHTALHELRTYFRKEFANNPYTRNDWLFPGKKEGSHLHVKTVKNTFIKVRDKLKLDSRISGKTLRHCFSTHSLEEGVEPVFIQHMLGHKRLQTTLNYMHMTSKSLMGIKSPLDTKENDET
jgi:site-specific recombinase XerD